MFWKSTIAQNTVTLFGVQILRKLIPLMTMPYLARTLGVGVWGEVAYAIAVGNMLTLLIEFGFHLSATRSISRSRESETECSTIVAGVIGVQSILFLLGAMMAFTSFLLLPQPGGSFKYFLASLALGCCQGFSPIWFFQGMEWIRTFAAVELSGKIAGVVGVFLFVQSPADGTTAVLLQAFGAGLSTAAGLYLLYKKIRFRAPCTSSMVAAVRNGWAMFLFRGATSLYGAMNVLILGLLAPLEYVSYFAAAEKIYTAVYGLLTPLQDALYPRLSHLVQRSSEPAAKLAFFGAIAGFVWSVILAVALFGSAPLIVRILVGPDFTGAVAPLRILACMLPAAAVMISTGPQWLVPLGKEAAVNTIVIAAGLANLVLAALLAPRYAHLGMAWSVAITETLLATAMVIVASRVSPFWKNQQPFAAAMMGAD